MFKETLLEGKRILVTGGGTGLGKEMASEYAKLGAEVYICGLTFFVLSMLTWRICSDVERTFRSAP